MARYGLGALAATSADGLLDAVWALVDGKTDHGWTWAREGTTDAVYATRSVTGGTLFIIVAGVLASTSPGGTFAPDTAGANRVWIGGGFVPTASTFTYAGWTAANPMTEGTFLGWTSWCVPTSGAIADEIELLVTEGGVWFRLEGTTTSTSRHAWAGDLCIPYSAGKLLGTGVTAQAHGACIGLWATPEGTPAGLNWATFNIQSGVFGFHSASAGAGHGWILDGSTRRAVNITMPVKRTLTATTSKGAAAVGGANAIVSVFAAPDDQDVGYCPHFAGALSTVDHTVTDGGIPVFHYARRDSASAGEALGISVARTSPGV
jgi:hypothetical protein